MSNVIPSVQTGDGFIQKKTPFDALLRKVQKVSPTAIDFLVATMEDEDCKDSRLKVAAASKLIDIHMTLLKDKNSDKIKRLENQIKLIGKLPDGEFSSDDGDDDDVPQIDFTKVVDISEN